MRRFLLSLAAVLAGLALTAPAQADDDDGHKEYLKRLKEQQKRQDEFYREQQKRYQEQLREQQKREDEFYREQAKRQVEFQREQRPFGHGGYAPGPGLYPPHGYPERPGRFYPPNGQRYFDPHRGQPSFSEDDLERHVEHTIKRQFGHAVKDIDVDVDKRRGRIKVEAEVRHPSVRTHLERLLYSMPELAGYGIRLDVEVDD